MKKVLLFVLTLVASIFLSHSSALAQSVPIYTCQDLQHMANNLSGSYYLANDIDCNDSKNWNSGAGFQPVGERDFGQNPPVNAPFVGQFNGQNHTISNLYINGTLASNVGIGTTAPGNVSIGTSNVTGLFGSINNATISNVNVEDATVMGAGSTGVLAGEVISGTIANVNVSGSVYGSWAGGLVGVSYSQNINNASANVQVRGSDANEVWLGGLIGYANAGPVSNSYATGSISNLYGTGDAYSGGLIGSIQNTYITNCYSKTSIMHKVSGVFHDAVGGLIGNAYSYNNNSINQSYAAGAIQLTGVPLTASTFVGGLVGDLIAGVAVNSSYWDLQSTGVASSAGSPQSAGLNTSQMYQSSSYVGWDFNNTWITDGQHYPIFIWQERNQIDLWNTFSAAYQPSTFEPFSPPNTINWTNVEAISYSGINWADLNIISRPPVWSFSSATPDSGNINSVNWNYLGALGDSSINWSDLLVVTRTGINWASVNPLVHSGINWADWLVASRSSVNWSDIKVLSLKGVNWANIGTLDELVNWTSLSQLTRQNINWQYVSNLSQEQIANWSIVDRLSLAGLSPEGINTLRTIGVDQSASNANTAGGPYTITVVGQGQGGGTVSSSSSLSGFGATTVAAGGSETYVVTPSSGSYISQILEDGNPIQGVPSAQPVTVNFTDVTANHILLITYTPDPTITISGAGAGSGTVYATGQGPAFGSNPIAYGSSASYTVAPGAGSYISAETINGVPVIPVQSTIKFTNVTANQNLVVTFGPVPINVTATIVDSADYPLMMFPPVGTHPTVTIQPAVTSWASTGLSSMTIRGVAVGTYNITISNPLYPAAVNYTLTVSQQDINNGYKSVTIIAPWYPVNVSAGVNGSITPAGVSGILEVPAGTSQTMTITPKTGYGISSLKVDGASIAPVSTYTFSSVSAAHSIAASFAQGYSITLTPYGTNGTILCNGSTTCPAFVSAGASMNFTAQPAAGNVFESWANTCSASGGSANGALCVINNINKNISLEAVFGLAPQTYTITTSTNGSGHGQILCNGVSCATPVVTGTKVTFTAQPAAGSILTGFGAPCAASGGPVYSCSLIVTSNISASANFIQSPPPGPRNLAARDSAAGVALTWIGPSYGVNFNVYRSQLGVNGDKYTLIKTVGYPASSYTDNTISRIGIYTYYVTAVYYPKIESPKSNVAIVIGTAVK